MAAAYLAAGQPYAVVPELVVRLGRPVGRRIERPAVRRPAREMGLAADWLCRGYTRESPCRSADRRPAHRHRLRQTPDARHNGCNCIWHSY